MRAELASSVLGYLRRLGGDTASGDTDGALLARFVATRDEAAFAALLARHGAMVLRVCERVLGPGCDAEDAFQASFLLLVDKAGTLRRGDSLGSWLHTAAYRIAARARAQRARRRELERRARPRLEETPALDLAWRELQAILDEELHGLPEKYRAPLLLCYLEGLSHEEAAARLRWPVGTVRSRLARARDRLRGRLCRRGLTLSATAFAAVLATGTAPAAPPLSLHDATLRAALQFVTGHRPGAPAHVLALVYGVSRAMTFQRFPAVVLVLIAGLAAVAGLSARLTTPERTIAPPRAGKSPGTVEGTGAPKDTAPAKVRITLRGHEEMVWAVGFSPDGKTLATVSGLYNKPGELILWDTATGKERIRVREEKGIRAVAFSPDGKTLATSDYYANVVRLRDPANGKIRAVLETGRANNAVAFSPDSKTLAVAILDRTAQLWDVGTARKLHELTGHTDWVPHVAFSPDGKMLATGSRDRSVKLWDVSSGQPLLTLAGHAGTIEFLAFSPDGRTLASAAWDKTVKLWEVATGKERATLKGHRFQVLSVAFSRDGRTLVTTSGEAFSPITTTSDKPGEIKLWDVATQQEFASLPGHRFRVWMAQYSPDGKTLVTSAEDRTIKLWDLAPRPVLPPRPATDKELTTWWDDLAGAEAARANRAVWALASARGVSFLTKKLNPAPPSDPKLQERLTRLLKDLDSGTFTVRERATTELRQLGREAEPVLRATLESRPSVEVRRRVEQLLEKLSGPVDDPATLRSIRAVEALERAGTGEARRLLGSLARGAPEARLTREASGALQRLATITP